MMLSADGQPDVTAPFLQFGAIGALALLLLWFALFAYRDLIKQRDECQDAAEVKDTLLREQATKHSAEMVALLNTVLPLVTQANTVITEAMTEVRRIREVR